MPIHKMCDSQVTTWPRSSRHKAGRYGLASIQTTRCWSPWRVRAGGSCCKKYDGMGLVIGLGVYHRKQGRTLSKWTFLLSVSGEGSNWRKECCCLSTRITEASLPQRQQQLGADQSVTKDLSPKLYMCPSSTSWCARTIVSSPFIPRNSCTTCLLKMKPAPRLFTDHPSRSVASGSDHTRSHMGPDSGMSLKRSIWVISSRKGREGESPPWTQKTWASMTAARGRQAKTWMILLQTWWLPYFLRTSSQKPQVRVREAVSWLPLRRTQEAGLRHLRASRQQMVSMEWQPRSTQSPRKTQLLCSGTIQTHPYSPPSAS